MKPVIAVAVVAVAATTAATARAQGLAPPPPGNYAGAARTVAHFFDTYYGYAQDPDFCFFSMRSAEDSFARNRETIRSLTGPEAQAFAAYYDDVLAPYFAPMRTGVPGYGTYDEIIAHREAAAAWLREHAPPVTPIETADDAARYIAAENAFLERVDAERAWTEGLIAAGPCIRYYIRRSSEHPRLGDFAAYRHWISETAIAQQVVEIRGRAWPHLRGPAQGANTLEHHLAGPFRSPGDLGTALLVVAADVRAIDEEDGDAALLAQLGAGLTHGAQQPIAQLLAARAKIRGALAAWFAEHIAAMGVWPAVKDGGAAAAMKAYVGHARGLVAARVTSKLTSFDEVRSEFAGKVFITPVRFSGKTYSFHVVRKGPPWERWPRDLGIEPAALCTVVGIAAVRYDRGAEVKRGVWEYNTDSPYPIRCVDADRTFAP